jgi:hypothetical protein
MATPISGVQSSYDFSTGVKINMDELIYLISPIDTPLLNGVGSDGNTVLSSAPVDQRKFSWMDEEMLLPRSTLAAQCVTAATEVVVAAGHQQRFSTGDILVVHTVGADERMRVTGYSATTADTLLVTRAYSGTASLSITGATVVALGTALAEGSDPENARSVDRDESYNLTQIFGPTKVSITRTEQGRGKYGISDELAHQMYLRMQESAIAREQAFLYGVRTESTTTKIRTTGGIDYFITTNEDSTSTELSVANIESSMENCYDAGGLPDQLWCNPKSTSTLNAAQDALVRVENVETQRGFRRVQLVTTEYGDIPIIRNRYVFKGEAFLVKKDGVTRRVFDPMITERLAKTGDSENWMFLCEEGLQVKGETHMAKLTNLTTY